MDRIVTDALSTRKRSAGHINRGHGKLLITLTALGVLAALLLLSACGAGATGEGAGSTQHSPRDILATAALHSPHSMAFSLHVSLADRSADSSLAPPSAAPQTITGMFVTQPLRRAALQYSVALNGQMLAVSTVYDSTGAYMRIGEGEWVRVSRAVAPQPFGLGALSQLCQISQVGGGYEYVDNRETFHLRALLPPDGTEGCPPSTSLAENIWIATDTYYPVRMRTIGVVSTPEGGSGERDITVDFSRWNSSIQIPLPQATALSLLPGKRVNTLESYETALSLRKAPQLIQPNGCEQVGGPYWRWWGAQFYLNECVVQDILSGIQLASTWVSLLSNFGGKVIASFGTVITWEDGRCGKRGIWWHVEWITSWWFPTVIVYFPSPLC